MVQIHKNIAYNYIYILKNITLIFFVFCIELSVRAGVLNTGREYSGSGKIRVGCISGSGRIQVECISVLRVLDEPNGFRAPFPRLFHFLSKSKTRHIYYLKLFVFNEMHSNCNLLKNIKCIQTFQQDIWSCRWVMSYGWMDWPVY